MFARVQVHEQKPVKNVKASAALKNGAPVSYAIATNTVGAATADTDYIVISGEDWSGINSVKEPNDAMFENIANGDKCLCFIAEKGDRIATTELTIGSLQVGDSLTVASGKFAAGSGNWAYGGVYDNPWGLTMYIVERV